MQGNNLSERPEYLREPPQKIESAHHDDIMPPRGGGGFEKMAWEMKQYTFGGQLALGNRGQVHVSNMLRALE